MKKFHLLNIGYYRCSRLLFHIHTIRLWIVRKWLSIAWRIRKILLIWESRLRNKLIWVVAWLHWKWSWTTWASISWTWYNIGRSLITRLIFYINFEKLKTYCCTLRFLSQSLQQQYPKRHIKGKHNRQSGSPSQSRSKQG